MKFLLTNQSLKNVKWSALERFSVQVLQIIIGILLARLVSPTEYGQVALIIIFVSIIQIIVEAGLTNALIQKINRNETDYCTVFYFSIVTSIILYGLFYNLSPYIANYYNEQVLNKACKVLGLMIIIQNLSIIQVAKLSVENNFKTQAKASIGAIIISGIFGLSLAYQGYGIWALIIQALVYSTLNSLTLWYLVKWYPKMAFCKKSFLILFNFSSKLMLSSILHSLYINVYGLLIGKFHTLSDVGYFNQANVLSRFPSVSLMAIIGRAIYPIQCSIQNDDQLLNSSNLKYMKMSCYIIFPIMTTLSVLAEPIINILLGEKWSNSVILFSILSIAYMLTPIMNCNSQILLVKGRSDLFLQAELIKKFIGVFIIVLTIQHDLYVICLGLVLYNLIDVIIIIYFTKKIINTGYVKQIKEILPNLLITFTTAVLISIVLTFLNNNILEIIIGLGVGFVSYFGLSKLFKIEEYILIEKIIRNVLVRD
jgi:teichuronic acid exporter